MHAVITHDSHSGESQTPPFFAPTPEGQTAWPSVDSPPRHDPLTLGCLTERFVEAHRDLLLHPVNNIGMVALGDYEDAGIALPMSGRDSFGLERTVSGRSPDSRDRRMLTVVLALPADALRSPGRRMATGDGAWEIRAFDNDGGIIYHQGVSDPQARRITFNSQLQVRSDETLPELPSLACALSTCLQLQPIRQAPAELRANRRAQIASLEEYMANPTISYTWGLNGRRIEAPALPVKAEAEIERRSRVIREIGFSAGKLLAPDRNTRPVSTSALTFAVK